MANEVILELTVLAETPASYLVTDEDVEVWLPKSQVTVEDDDDVTIGITYSFVVPEWIATQKGLV